MEIQELKAGFEFLQPILNAGINFPFKWNEELGGYYNADADEVLLADGKLYRPIALQRDRMILKYESGEIEMDEEYNQLKKWQNSENQMKIVDAEGNDASIFNAEKFIEMAQKPKTKCKGAILLNIKVDDDIKTKSKGDSK